MNTTLIRGPIRVPFFRYLGVLLTVSIFFPVFGASQTEKKGEAVPMAPPPAPPAISQEDPPGVSFPATTLYSIGDPTDQEQYYLELINRARANPPAEGLRLAETEDTDIVGAYDFFDVDLELMQEEFDAIAPAPPLAMNARLTEAARGHTQDMLDNVFQGHVSSNGDTLADRLTAAGYPYATAGENVFSFAESVEYGHAGFEVDWGNGPGGMQDPRGHRNSIHNGDFREVGIGVLNGTNTDGGTTVGPQLVTQDFGRTNAGDAFVTGVVYYDLDENGIYNPGEGVGGVTVTVEGASHHAVTTDSGGYAVPVPAGDATRTVVFSGPGLSASRSAVIANGENVKVDFIPEYAPPVPHGTETPYAGYANTYSFPPVGGATSHEWRYSGKDPVAADGAENLDRVIDGTSGSYSAVSTTVNHAGSGAYWLAHPDAESESLTYEDDFLVEAGASLGFYSRLGWATENQVATVQVSDDGGRSWSDVYSQAGTGDAGETSFTERTVSLADYAGEVIHMRFRYFLGGEHYPQTDDGFGWYVDGITFTNLFTMTDPVITEVPAGTAFSFSPAEEGTFLLSVRPVISGGGWNFSPSLEVEAIAGEPSQFASWAGSRESDAGLPEGTIGENPEADYSGDGLSNIVAYALDLPVVSSASSLLPRPEVDGESGLFHLDYARDTARPDVIVVPEISSDFDEWFAPEDPGAPAGFQDALLSTEGVVENRRASIPVESANGWFLRLRVFFAE